MRLFPFILFNPALKHWAIYIKLRRNSTFTFVLFTFALAIGQHVRFRHQLFFLLLTK